MHRALVVTAMCACGSVASTPDAIVDQAPSIDADVSPGASCDTWYARGVRTSGSYLIDPDADGADAPFAVYCDLAGDAGWTLAATISIEDPGRWDVQASWAQTTPFGASDSSSFTDDMKNKAYGAMPFTRLRLVTSYGGVMTSEPKSMPMPMPMPMPMTLATLFASTSRVSFTGTSVGWTYATTNNYNFIAEIQNPPAIDGVNRAERNKCVLATGYDTFPEPPATNAGTDDQVQGFGCVAGTGGANPTCTFGACGEVSRESSTQLFIR